MFYTSSGLFNLSIYSSQFGFGSATVTPRSSNCAAIFARLDVNASSIEPLLYKSANCVSITVNCLDNAAICSFLKASTSACSSASRSASACASASASSAAGLWSYQVTSLQTKRLRQNLSEPLFFLLFQFNLAQNHVQNHHYGKAHRKTHGANVGMLSF